MSSRPTSKSSGQRTSAISISREDRRCSSALYALALAVSVASTPGIARAQVADTVIPSVRTVSGRVEVARRSGPLPLPGAWVVVHRIVGDESGNVTGGALDSARTGRDGSFSIDYRHFGPSSATYIALTTYSGVTYLTSPLTLPSVTGEDGSIIVYDTVPPPLRMRVESRHFVVTAPDSGETRRIVEVYAIHNDSTVTVLGAPGRPAFVVPLPKGATKVEVNPVGDFAPGSATVNGDRLEINAPISPGLRTLSFTYTLAPEAFPLSVPMPDTVARLEVLVQEPAATVEGAGLAEVPGVTQEGTSFRRLLAGEVPPSAVLRVSVPAIVSTNAGRNVAAVAIVLGAAMLAALGFAFWRRRQPPRSSPRIVDPVDDLVRELAAMDAEFERRPAPTDAERAEFEARRGAIKARLNAALAARQTRA